MDPLVQVLEHLAPHGLSWKHISGGATWMLTLPTEPGIVFGMVLDGEAWAKGKGTITLRQGDYLLLVAPATWTLGCGSCRKEGIVEDADMHTRTLRVGSPGCEPVVRIMAGHFQTNPNVAGLLQRLLPAVLHIRAEEASSKRLNKLLTMINEEMELDNPGSTFVVQRLVEIMLVEALRAQLRMSGEIAPSLLGGLADTRLARAIRAIHDDIGRAWTVKKLSLIAGMSRSRFAESFVRQVGLSPIAYLTIWRLALAKEALRGTTRPVSEIALMTGYSSTSAFSNAFRSTVGCAPARYRAGSD